MRAEVKGSFCPAPLVRDTLSEHILQSCKRLCPRAHCRDRLHFSSALNDIDQSSLNSRISNSGIADG